MPWSAQVCEFCGKRYANKKGLFDHLSLYTGSLRVPADGIHDVLQIKQAIRRLYPSKYDQDEDRMYKCWTCGKIIPSRVNFIYHVIYRKHCGYESATYRHRCKWPFPFDEKTVLISDDPFPFLQLPPELRIKIYQYILCFKKVYFKNEACYRRQERDRNGVWLQHNPRDNVLAIMPVSHQIYAEARRVFYAENKFSFHSFVTLFVFLVGIGAENARLLRSVRCKNAEGKEHIDCTDHIQSCLRQAAPTEDTGTGNLQAQNVEDLYVRLADPDLLGRKWMPFYWTDGRCLLRADSRPVSPLPWPNRLRFELSPILRKEGKDGGDTDILCTAAFELVSMERRKDPEGSTAH